MNEKSSPGKKQQSGQQFRNYPQGSQILQNSRINEHRRKHYVVLLTGNQGKCRVTSRVGCRSGFEEFKTQSTWSTKR